MRFSTRMLLGAAFLALSVAGLACAVYPPPGPPGPPLSGAAAMFYGDLAPFGDWVWLEVHGWVWTPHGVPASWRPYTDGRWVRTPHGWTWVSDWPWGWAPFHYGRWLWTDRAGWVWIPGSEWAPAWVAWRYAPGWVGWAPLPPGATWRVGVGFDLGEVTLDFAWWSFARSEHFIDARLHRWILPLERNAALARSTRPVTRYERGDRGVVERSISLRDIERDVRRPIPELRIDDLRRAPRAEAEPIEGDRLRVYRPAPSTSGDRGSRAKADGATASGKSDSGKSGASRSRPPKPNGES